LKVKLAQIWEWRGF